MTLAFDRSAYAFLGARSLGALEARWLRELFWRVSESLELCKNVYVSVHFPG